MNDAEWNGLFHKSDKGLLKARVRRIEVAMATSVKRASDQTSDQSINLGIAFSFIKRFTRDSKLIAPNKKGKKRRKKAAIVGNQDPLKKYSNAGVLRLRLPRGEYG